MSRLFYIGDGKEVDWQNIPGIYPASLSYDDVLLVPQETDVTSRSEVDTSVQFGPYKLKIPVISSPMDTITGEAMVRELDRLGAIGALPRGNEQTIDEVIAICQRLTKDKVACLYAVGLKNGFEHAKKLKKAGAKMILVDVANGAMLQAKELAQKIKKDLDVFVVAGNIATHKEALSYQKYKIDITKVGIGPGGLCTTRLIAGTGVPQLAAVFDTVSTGEYIIADGGIVHPGDVAKAIAAGAMIVMIGSLFGGCDETPGEVDVEGMKLVRGQASFGYMKDNSVKDGQRTAEGITTKVRAKGPVRNIISQIDGGLRSAMSYSGARNIKEFQEKSRFVVSSYSTQTESKPHIIWME